MINFIYVLDDYRTGKHLAFNNINAVRKYLCEMYAAELISSDYNLNLADRDRDVDFDEKLYREKLLRITEDIRHLAEPIPYIEDRAEVFEVEVIE